METVANFIKLEMTLLLLAFWLIIFYQLLTGKINTDGMNNDKTTGGMSPGRIQLLFFTFIGIFYFVVQLMQNPGQIPEIPEQLLIILAGSNFIYLSGKSGSLGVAGRLFKK